MTNRIRQVLALIFPLLLLYACGDPEANGNGHNLLLTNVSLIDGTGAAPQEQIDVLIKGDRIAALGKDLDSSDAEVIDLKGKTIIPALISSHMHLGTLKGTENKAENYTAENIQAQLIKYQDYGIENIMSMGTDRPLLFETGLRDSSQTNTFNGARIHTAAYGFGVPNGAPPIGSAMDKVYRPASPEQVAAQMDSLAELKPDLVKIWVDDFGGEQPKMDPKVYKAIIDEAHRHQLRVAAHVYYLNDARQLVADGIDLFAHSIRDSLVDDQLVEEMKRKQVAYIPTLSLDEFSYIYARKPEWLNDVFFKASLEPGVYEMITSESYQQEAKNNPSYSKNLAAFEMALKNLKKLFDAGILIALGTDSGAMPIRAQGFSEHLELELMVQAGLSPLQAITVASKNAAELLKIDDEFGTVEDGKIADFVILDASPEKDIKNTRKIFAVYRAGKKVSDGPVN